MGNFKKGIRGQLIIPFNDNSKKNLEENAYFKLLDNNGQLLKNIENVTDENGNWIATCNYEVQRINK